MTLLHRLVAVVRWIFRRQTAERDLHNELQAFIDLSAADKMRAGVEPAEAHRLARLELGGMDQTKERVRTERHGALLDELGCDLRYALRMFAKNRGFTAVAVLTLTLGIGANTAVFSVAYSILFRPLPYSDSNRIIRIIQNPSSVLTSDSVSMRLSAISTDDLRRWRTATKTFSHMAAYFGPSRGILHETGVSAYVQTAAVSPAIFPLLRAEPLLGRLFDTADEREDNSSVVILSYVAWRKYWAGEPDVLNRIINLEEGRYRVVGVMPQAFEFPNRETEFWIPLVLETRESRATAYVQTLARLADDVSIEAATAEANALFQGFRREDTGALVSPPSLSPPEERTRIELVRLNDELVAPVKSALLVLLVAVGFVLLIACGNVANLLLARAANRQAEMSIRAALGASRGRLIRQMLTETIMLALFGGIAGTLFAFVGVRFIAAIGAQAIPRSEDIRIDLPAFVFTLTVSIFVGVLFGLAPALRVRVANHMEVIQKGSASASSGSDLFTQNRTRSILVIAEIALATILLAGAGLLMSSFLKLSTTDWGYDPENVLTFSINLPQDQSRYSGKQAQTLFYDELQSRIEKLPQTLAVGVSHGVPILQPESMGGGSIHIVGRPRQTKPDSASVRLVSNRYTQTMGMRILEGRAFDAGDRKGQPPVMLINKTLATAYFQNENAIGQSILIGPGAPIRIVGIVNDLRYAGLDQEPVPEIYLNMRQAADFLGQAPPLPPSVPGLATPTVNGFGKGISFHVRTRGEPTAIVPDIRSVVEQMDSQLIVEEIVTMEQLLSQYVARPRFYTALIGSFSVIAIALAAIGIYGLTVYLVSQRTREIGIRIALGAKPPEVLWLVLRQGLALTAVGISVGILGAFQLTQFLKGMLYGLTPTDPFTFVVITAAMAIVAAFASYVPARWATKVDPVIALRCE